MANINLISSHFLKRRWLIMLLLFTLTTCSDDEPNPIVSFSGQITGTDVDGNSVQLANIPVDIVFYSRTGFNMPEFLPVRTERVTTDANGRYTLSKRIATDKYPVYGVEPVDDYYKRCVGSLNFSEYEYQAIESSNLKDVARCMTSHVLIRANKTEPASSNRIYVDYKTPTVPGTIIVDNPTWVLDESGEFSLNFRPDIAEVEITFSLRNKSTIIRTTTLTQALEPGTTITIDQDF